MFKIEKEINTAKCFREVKKQRSARWLCQLVLLGDLDKSISGRGGGNGSESTEIKKKGA